MNRYTVPLSWLWQIVGPNYPLIKHAPGSNCKSSYGTSTPQNFLDGGLPYFATDYSLSRIEQTLSVKSYSKVETKTIVIFSVPCAPLGIPSPFWDLHFGALILSLNLYDHCHTPCHSSHRDLKKRQ
jgi:hypothetical protein